MSTSCLEDATISLTDPLFFLSISKDHQKQLAMNLCCLASEACSSPALFHKLFHGDLDGLFPSKDITLLHGIGNNVLIGASEPENNNKTPS